MKFGEMLLQQAGGAAVGGLMGMAMQSWQEKRQLKQQAKLQEMQEQGNLRMLEAQRKKELQMWKDTNYSAQIEQLEKAGLNPGLLYGKGGGGGTTIGGSGMGVSAGSAAQAANGSFQGMALMMQMQQQAAQTEVMKSQARLNNVNADNAAGVNKDKTVADTENVKQNTANAILEGKLKELGIWQAEMDKKRREGWSGVESKTYGDEMAARQAIANNVYELSVSGQLEQKSLAEIEAVTLGNAKTREEIRNIQKQFDILEETLKGQKLSNVILELEKDLQTKTGIDKNSNGFLKILGRLFIMLTDK